MYLTKEEKYERAYPPIPPNCPQFMMVKMKSGKDRLIFSCFTHHADTSTWSHDADFPWNVDMTQDYMRPIIAAVAYCGWREVFEGVATKLHERPPTPEETSTMCNADESMFLWKKLALEDPDEEEDEDDDIDLPIVFKKEKKQCTH